MPTTPHGDLPSQSDLQYWGSFGAVGALVASMAVWLWRQTFIGTFGRWVGRTFHRFIVTPIADRMERSINETLVERVRAGFADEFNALRHQNVEALQGNNAIIELIQQGDRRMERMEGKIDDQDTRMEAVRLELLERIKRRRRNDPPDADS